MTPNGENQVGATTDSTIAGGGGASALNLTTEKDRGLARTAMRRWPKRWRGLSEEFKERCVKELQVALDEANEADKPEVAAGIRVSAVKTAVMMEGQHQADDHLDEKYNRLDHGQDTESVAHRAVLHVSGVSGDGL